MAANDVGCFVLIAGPSVGFGVRKGVVAECQGLVLYF